MGIYAIPTKNGLQSSLSSSMSLAETTSFAIADDWSSYLSDVSASRPVILCIDRIDASGTTVTPAKREYVKAVAVSGGSGTTFTTLTRGQGGSTQQAHTAGAIVELVGDVDTIKSITDGVLVEHNADGTHGTATVTTLKATGAEVSTGTSDVKIVTPKALKDSVLFNAPEGFLINGKIVPSVASNNLTVAIKGMDGNDPSATNPVYCRINGVMRAITSALSITRNAGTNYGNAGSAELASKEHDLFVYLMDNTNTNSISVHFSRVPYGNIASDFTVANAISDNSIQSAVGFNTTDTVVNIGRFAATLSAGAGYTWSVPTFTATNLIQRPIYETRALFWQPSFSAGGSMTWGPTGGTFVYQIIGKRFFSQIDSGNGTTGGTASANVNVSLPINRISNIAYQNIGSAKIADGTNQWGNVQFDGSTAVVSFYKTSDANWTLGANRAVTANINYLIAN